MVAVPFILHQLDRWGPDRSEAVTEAEARVWCRRLAGGHYENFSVLSRLVPRGLEPDFAAVYAFCRCADDLGDESGSPQRGAELLGWWRRELQGCFAGAPAHPVFVALAPVIVRHQLPIGPFDDLIRAFELDQTITRCQTWSQLLGYCRLSADPVGRLVLMLLGERRDESIFRLSDAVCTALQLTNHWQDIRRDRLERNRIYIPQELIAIDDFERRLEVSARQGFGCDHRFLEETRHLVRALVERTWPLFDEGRELLEEVAPTSRPVIELFIAGGEHVLSQIAAWNFETVLHRPRVTAPVKLWLVTRAMLQAWRVGRAAARRSAA